MLQIWHPYTAGDMNKIIKRVEEVKVGGRKEEAAGKFGFGVFVLFFYGLFGGCELLLVKFSRKGVHFYVRNSVAFGDCCYGSNGIVTVKKNILGGFFIVCVSL